MYLRRTALAVVVSLAALAAPAARATSGEPSEWVVRFHDGVTPEARADALDQLGVTVLDTMAGSNFTLVAAETAPAHAAIADARPQVEMYAAALPDDPIYEFQWHLHAVQAHRAWDISTGAGVIVAVLDTGAAFEDVDVYRRAPDLAGTHFVAGWDFVNADGHPNDDHGHGTHVTGTIAQTTNNGLGGAGVAPRSTIMPIKVLDDTGAGRDWDIAKGLRFAADNGADVANLSFGAVDNSPVVADAVKYAVNKGVIVVAATGNEGGPVAYPAALPEVIAVGAVRVDGIRPDYANFGPQVDVVAPGGDVELDQNGDTHPDGILQQTLADGNPGKFCWCFFDGTSMSAPHVSGVAALLAAQGRATTPELVRSVIRATALDLGTVGRDEDTGSGLVQAYDALVAARALPRVSRNFTNTARSAALACPPEVVPEDAFPDVPSTNPHEPAIDCLSWWAVATGVSPLEFGPAADITRAQMASMLARLALAGGVELPANPADAFSDDESSAHEQSIDQLAALGVVSGTAPGVFSPSDRVSRAQMASFLVRTLELATGPLGPASGDRFGDDEGLIHEPTIELAAELGIAAGTGPVEFSPQVNVRRDQMASFLARGLDVLVQAGRATLPSS